MKRIAYVKLSAIIKIKELYIDRKFTGSTTVRTGVDTVVDTLAQLLDDGHFDQALRLAEQELLKSGWNRPQLARVNLVICRCRLELGDPFGAVPSGLLAAKLARDLGEWDLLAESLLFTGTAMTGTRQLDQALYQLYQYFEHMHLYNSARSLEGSVWRAVGIAHQRKQESDKALNALVRARKWFLTHESDRDAFACTSDMINTYLNIHERDSSMSLEPVGDLLRYEKELSSRHAGDSYYLATCRLDEASIYLRQGRLGRAMVRALQASEARKADATLVFHAYMVLHRCSRLSGLSKQALGYAVAARAKALQSKNYEMEFVASQAMADVVREHGSGVVRELEQEYQGMGVNLSQYLTPDLLRRYN